MKKHRTVLKLLFFVALLATNAILFARPLLAQTYSGYCTFSTNQWVCSFDCPPLGCNCDCNVNCAGDSC